VWRVKNVKVQNPNFKSNPSALVSSPQELRRAGKASADKNVKLNNSTNFDKILHKTIKKVTEDIENLRFNTAVSALMIAVNEMEKAESVTREQFEIFLQILAPFAPHVTEELWSVVGNKKSIHLSGWPVCDESLIVDDKKTIVVQINGKVRSSLVAPTDIGEEELKQLALNLPEVKKWLDGKEVKKVIVVPGKLVSVVLT
jgi:leucyl-tRNA synthetase